MGQRGMVSRLCGEITGSCLTFGTWGAASAPGQPSVDELRAALRLLHVDPLTIGVSVVITGMPIGSTTAILAQKYVADAKFASKCVFISTLTSLVTVPILTLFL